MTPNKTYCGDAIKLLSTWPAGCVDLAFADPPFNIGYVYDTYRDDMPDSQYVAWTQQWMSACKRVLKPDGSFYIAIGDDFAADVRILGRELGLTLRNWIIWHYNFGQSMKNKFARGHTHVFYFTRDRKRFTFNDRAVRFPSARHTEYQDLRAHPAGRVPDDVWDEFPRVCGTFAERQGFHGCQMPEALLTRIILASSNPGDIVLDPFAGSGTTAAAAKRIGRRYVTIDLSPEYVQHVTKRLETVRDESALPANAETWPALHSDLLAQLYRETGVSLSNLLPNEVALRVIAASVKARCGAAYSVAQIRDRLEALCATLTLPKLPNDREFVARKHVTETGKRYKRQTTRLRKRRTEAATTGILERNAREAM
ncbi:MAG: DNA methyltransferase [Phycisphaerae bacterium]